MPGRPFYAYDGVMDIVTALSGASGALYAQRFVQGLVAARVNVHLVVSPWGRRLLRESETPTLTQPPI